MKLLFRREQTSGRVGRIGRVQFKLWAQLDRDADENEIIKRYRFDEAVLIEAIQPTLIRNTLLIAIGSFAVAFFAFGLALGMTYGGLLAICTGLAGGYWWFHEKRETIYVRDLLHGRYFSCPSVIELARKEAWLRVVTSFLRQVMESAKHWDGTEASEIEALPKAEARLVMLRGL